MMMVGKERPWGAGETKQTWRINDVRSLGGKMLLLVLFPLTCYCLMLLSRLLSLFVKKKKR